jgi:hypothetical protein
MATQIPIGSYFSAYAFQKTWANQNLHSLQPSKVVPSGKKPGKIWSNTGP